MADPPTFQWRLYSGQPPPSAPSIPWWANPPPHRSGLRGRPIPHLASQSSREPAPAQAPTFVLVSVPRGPAASVPRSRASRQRPPPAGKDHRFVQQGPLHVRHPRLSCVHPLGQATFPAPSGVPAAPVQGCPGVPKTPGGGGGGWGVCGGEYSHSALRPGQAPHPLRCRSAGAQLAQPHPQCCAAVVCPDPCHTRRRDMACRCCPSPCRVPLGRAEEGGTEGEGREPAVTLGVGIRQPTSAPVVQNSSFQG